MLKGSKVYKRAKKIERFETTRSDGVSVVVIRWEDKHPGRLERKSWVSWHVDGECVRRVQFSGEARHRELDEEWAETRGLFE